MPFSTGCPESSKLAVEFIMKISELQNNSQCYFRTQQKTFYKFVKHFYLYVNKAA